MKSGIMRGAFAAAAFGLLSTSVLALEKQPVLSLDVARKMAATCEAMAITKGWKMNIAVVDAGANTILFERMNGSFFGSGEIALNKAQTSAKFPFPTRFVEELAYGKAGKPPAVPGLVHVPGIIAFAGGLPLMAAGAHIGGIGVSGGTADEDEVCAQAGIESVKALLN